MKNKKVKKTNKQYYKDKPEYYKAVNNKNNILAKIRYHRKKIHTITNECQKQHILVIIKDCESELITANEKLIRAKSLYRIRVYDKLEHLQHPSQVEPQQAITLIEA